MNNHLYITASLDQPELLETMVEKLASRHFDTQYDNTNVIDQWQRSNTSSIEKYVSGTVELVLDGSEKIKMPFVTCFIFSCKREETNGYKLNWSMSLS